MTLVPKEPEAAVLALEGREVRVTHPDKLYFSRQARLTKLDLVRYFLSFRRARWLESGIARWC